MAEVERKKISKKIQEYIIANAKTRTNGVDTTTAFAIPGSHLPARHCDIYLTATVLTCADTSVFISLNNTKINDTDPDESPDCDHSSKCKLGHIRQSVKGTKYICKLFLCPYQFKLNIPTGPSDWNNARFTDMNDNPIYLNKDDREATGENERYNVYLLSEGNLTKADANTNYFDWQFGPPQTIETGQEYEVRYITESKPYTQPTSGGQSNSDSRFKLCGKLTDFGWSKGLEGNSTDGKIWLCGGILYANPNSTITSPITAIAVDVTIPGLNLGTYYYPGDIRKFDRQSLNRPEGYLRIRSSGFDVDRLPDYLTGDNDPDAESYAGWRPVKNTENDSLTIDPESGFENWGFRLVNGKWTRLIITGKTSDSDESEEPTADGIGSDSSGSTSSSGSGICPCCQLR